MQKTVSTIVVVVIALLTTSLIALRLPQAAHAQGSGPTTTPDPVIALETQVSAQSTEIALFNDRMDLHQERVEIDVDKRLQPYLIGGAILVALASLAGVTSWANFKTKAHELLKQSDMRYEELAKQAGLRAEERLNAAIYRADPTYLPIHVPAANFSDEVRRLRLLGFQNLKPYSSLTTKQTSGIIIYSASDAQDIQALEHFILDFQLRPDQAALIIYTPGRIEGGEKIYKAFDNVTFANNAVTVATHIYAVARGLTKIN